MAQQPQNNPQGELTDPLMGFTTKNQLVNLGKYSWLK